MAQPIRSRLIGQLRAKGLPVGEAQAVATKTLQKAGDLKPGSTQPTAKGVKRTVMGAAGRAKDRAAKASSSHKAQDFAYNPKTNRATLKRGMVGKPK
jgi:hypothetical protein